MRLLSSISPLLPWPAWTTRMWHLGRRAFPRVAMSIPSRPTRLRRSEGSWPWSTYTTVCWTNVLTFSDHTWSRRAFGCCIKLQYSVPSPSWQGLTVRMSASEYMHYDEVWQGDIAGRARYTNRKAFMPEWFLHWQESPQDDSTEGGQDFLGI